jgi:hypothetical protein
LKIRKERGGWWVEEDLVLFFISCVFFWITKRPTNLTPCRINDRTQLEAPQSLNPLKMELPQAAQPNPCKAHTLPHNHANQALPFDLYDNDKYFTSLEHNKSNRASVT